MIGAALLAVAAVIAALVLAVRMIMEDVLRLRGKK